MCLWCVHFPNAYFLTAPTAFGVELWRFAKYVHTMLSKEPPLPPLPPAHRDLPGLDCRIGPGLCSRSFLWGCVLRVSWVCSHVSAQSLWTRRGKCFSFVDLRFRGFYKSKSAIWILPASRRWLGARPVCLRPGLRTGRFDDVSAAVVQSGVVFSGTFMVLVLCSQMWEDWYWPGYCCVPVHRGGSRSGRLLAHRSVFVGGHDFLGRQGYTVSCWIWSAPMKITWQR